MISQINIFLPANKKVIAAARFVTGDARWYPIFKPKIRVLGKLECLGIENVGMLVYF
jgi:hypothetical protein